ncbi:MAG: type II secretion system F family protein [Mariprofundaceae bacterium]|nr:type II secretion system F family protein [Mariprofundaceae bacterium]
MSLFAYEAVDHRGRTQKGEIEADSERAVRSQLKGKSLIARRITPARSKHNGPDQEALRSLDDTETITFMQQLATLLAAGLPMSEALDSIAGSMESKRGRQLVVALRQQVMEGNALAAAMQETGFDDVVCNMVAAGEETGKLEVVSSRLAQVLEQSRELRQEVMSAVLYPMVVSGFGLLVMAFLLTVVVPQIAGVFARAGGDLPVLTSMIISLSTLLREHGLWLVAGLVLLVLAYRFAMRLPNLRRRRDALLLALPGVGTLLRKMETARYARTLGMLLAGGVPVLSALNIASQSLLLEPVREAAMAAREAMREGESLAERLRLSGYVPHLAIRLIAAGEQSGQLDAMLIRVADTFDTETSRNLKRLVTVLEPLLVMLMAVMVGVLAMAILLPIMEMNELVR